jgi:hypothetical protein
MKEDLKDQLIKLQRKLIDLLGREYLFEGLRKDISAIEIELFKIEVDECTRLPQKTVNNFA